MDVKEQEECPENEHYSRHSAVRRHLFHPWVSLSYSTVTLDSTCLNHTFSFILVVTVSMTAIVTIMLCNNPPRKSQLQIKMCGEVGSEGLHAHFLLLLWWRPVFPRRWQRCKRANRTTVQAFAHGMTANIPLTKASLRVNRNIRRSGKNTPFY